MFLLFIMQKQSSRGREHLVDFERSEEIYLVTCDRVVLVARLESGRILG